jgi:hypothetical protein
MLLKKKNKVNPRINSIENERIKEKRKKKRNRGI